jgi:hypothetical protein
MMAGSCSLFGAASALTGPHKCASQAGRERVERRSARAGHWPFDGKEPLIVVGDDEEEWFGLHGTSMGPKYGKRRAGSAHISSNARSKIAKSSHL